MQTENDSANAALVVRRPRQHEVLRPSTDNGDQLDGIPAGPLGNQKYPHLAVKFFRNTPPGLAGNLNGWRNYSTHSADSEFSQWLHARNAATRSGSDDTPDSQDIENSTLCRLEHEGQFYILRRLRGGRLVAHGQLAIDRSPSTDLTIRKNAWAAAVALRDRSKNSGTPSRSQDSRPHSCQFCNSNVDESAVPAWLYDRQQYKTISVLSEFQSEVPKYDVLSYTWGRAASNDWQDVDGVPWKIRSSTGLPVRRVFEILDRFEERYVWIDVFCMPQDCPTAKAREVARQAKIFRRAEGGVAWLHQTSAVTVLLAGLISWAVLVRDIFGADVMPQPSPPGAFNGLEELVSDPWFSSTWALQEAILRPNMRLMGTEEPSNLIVFPYGTLSRATHVTSHTTIEDFRQYLTILRYTASSTIKAHMQRLTVTGQESQSPLRVEDALKLEKLIQDLGLSAIITPNPASILASLQIRKSVKPHDQFYGIQSAFNLGMQGDYRRPLESVRAEFISHIWTEFSPVLALALNRPVITARSGHFMIDTEDTLVWFSPSAMEDGRLSCLPLGYSKIRASATPEGKPVLVSSECEETDSDLWRYEADSEPPCHSKILAIRFGLPPLPVEFSLAKTMDDLYQDSPTDRLKSKSWHRRYTEWCSRKLEGWQDRRGTSSFMDRTTRLLYVGKFINEFGHLGLRRDPHVYIEYYLKGPGEGHRVGALVSDLQFGHRKVNGALTLD